METKTNKEKNITVELTHEDVVHLVFGVDPSFEIAQFFINKGMGDFTGTQWGITGWQWKGNKLRKLSTEYLWYVYQCLVKNELPKH